MFIQNMDLEASVVERLQKLRQWQLEQQERLLKQQQIQRQMLTEKQDCMYKALELSIQELDLNEDVLDTNNSNEFVENIGINNENLITLHSKPQMKENYVQVVNKTGFNENIDNNFRNVNSPQRSPTQRFTEDTISIKSQIRKQSKDKTMCNIKNEIKAEKQLEQFVIDGIAPLTPDKIIVNRISIDDVPISSPKKDFHTLLEERLKDSENDHLDKFNTNLGNKIKKKPFLRKGAGLARFKLNQQSQLSIQKTKLHTNNTKSGSKCSTNKNKCNKTQHSKNAQLSKKTYHTNATQKHLCLKNVSLPKKKICTKSESNTSTTYLKDYINKMKNTVELNTSDFHSGTQKELEEVRIFELLEEKAENSSFCSTSSTVTAFLQQSTPFKVRNAGYKTENSLYNEKQVVPKSNIPKEQLAVKSNQVYKSTKFNKDTESRDFSPFKNQKREFLQDTSEDNKMKSNRNRYILLKDQIQSMHNEQNYFNKINVPIVENDKKEDVSRHVRFSEFNEYKTIELTDTSSISTESLITKNFSDEKIWSDSSVEASSTEILPVSFETPQSSIVIENKMHKTQTCEDTIENNDFSCNADMCQYVCSKDKLSDSEDQTSNDETSNLYKYDQNNLTPQKIDDFYNVETLKKQHTESCDNKEIDEYVNNYDNVVEDQENIKNLQETDETIFKSELLKNRLLELEQEINIFRKENTALSMQRKKLREDYQNLRKEYAEKEKKFEENKKQIEERLQEERKKLAREKFALENRIRDSQEKAQQSKLERQEIQNLRQEIEKLVEEMHIKESRWNAAQSRQRCQMRILRIENSKLKQEIEELQNLKKNVKSKSRTGTSTNTRAIHQINKRIKMQFKESQKINDASSDDDKKLIEPILNDQILNIDKGKERNCDGDKNIMNDKPQKNQTSISDIVKKRNLYENLIKEATLDLREIPEKFDALENLNESKSESDPNNTLKTVDGQTNAIKSKCKRSHKECDVFFNHNDDNNQLHMQNDYKCFDENNKKDLTSSIADKLFNLDIEERSSSYKNNTNTDKQCVIQIEHTDGSIEYRFTNGNIKKVFPDQGITKLMYYNGDVRETNRDGRIKYFYASTHTWHTTMPDGLEILEFAE